MTIQALQARLQQMKIWHSGMELEPYDWLTTAGPPDAFDAFAAYRLIDRSQKPARGAGGRTWEPVLTVADALWVGPSLEMLENLFAAARYFDRPHTFDEQLLTQFHRFALDYFQGYQVREEQFVYTDGLLTITGYAVRRQERDSQRFDFTTQVRRHEPAQFDVRPQQNQADLPF